MKEAEIIKAICNTMQCDKCPCQCEAREHSSLANCVYHWTVLFSKIDTAQCDWSKIREEVAMLEIK